MNYGIPIVSTRSWWFQIFVCSFSALPGQKWSNLTILYTNMFQMGGNQPPTICGCFNTPLEHTPSNLCQQAKNKGIPFIVGVGHGDCRLGVRYRGVWYLSWKRGIRIVWPIVSMYGISTYIYHKDQPNVGKYTSPMDPMGEMFFFWSFLGLWHLQDIRIHGMNLFFV